jgi:hypothetical protein
MTAQERAALVALVAKLDREIREPLEVAASYDVPEEATLGWRLHGRECRKALVALDGLKLAALSALPSGGAEGPTREQVEALARETAKKLTDHHPSYRREPQVYEIVLAALKQSSGGAEDALVASLPYCEACGNKMSMCGCISTATLRDRERAAFMAGWQWGVNAVDNYGETNGTADEDYTAWLATQQKEPTP